MSTTTKHNIEIRNIKTSEVLDTVRFHTASKAHTIAKKWSQNNDQRDPKTTEYVVVNKQNPEDFTVYRDGNRYDGEPNSVVISDDIEEQVKPKKSSTGIKKVLIILGIGVGIYLLLRKFGISSGFLRNILTVLYNRFRRNSNPEDFEDIETIFRPIEEDNARVDVKLITAE